MSDLPDAEHASWIESVVTRFEGPLLRYAVHLTGDRERGRDVVQDTFLRLCRHQRGELDGHLAEWLYTVCRNRALDVIRKERRMTIISAEQTKAQISRDDSGDQRAERRDTSEYILQLVEGLTENQREVLRLKFQSGLSYREISQVTQLSVSNVGYLIHTAIRKLREQMDT